MSSHFILVQKKFPQKTSDIQVRSFFVKSISGEKGQPYIQFFSRTQNFSFSSDAQDLRYSLFHRLRGQDHIRHVGRLQPAVHEVNDRVRRVAAHQRDN